MRQVTTRALHSLRRLRPPRSGKNYNAHANASSKHLPMSDGPQTHDEDHSPTRQRIMTPINTLVFRHQAATSHEKVSTDTTIIIICEICDTCTGYPHDVHSLYDTVDQITPPLPSLTSSKERERASARAEKEIRRERERENCIKRGGLLLLMHVVTIANVYACTCRLRCSLFLRRTWHTHLYEFAYVCRHYC